jgi:UDP-2,3-diacylglucosamine hydrolase
MDEIKEDAQVLFLMGDLLISGMNGNMFPKGYVRVLGKIAELKDRGIHIYFCGKP